MPLAAAYAGHQFGGFSPQLGDGRAVLLGEVVGPDGIRRDLQLKGAGRTFFSRGGDGRAAIGPVLREYLVSEAMHALGVPTTRALAVVTTGEPVQRETPLPGAVLTRVAHSHLRVGSFQFHYARQDKPALETLTEYARARHYPEAEGPLGLLDGVVDAQAKLVAKWMGLGFIHGVMNTDNSSISGETIDYGPAPFWTPTTPKPCLALSTAKAVMPMPTSPKSRCGTFRSWRKHWCRWWVRLKSWRPALAGLMISTPLNSPAFLPPS